MEMLNYICPDCKNELVNEGQFLQCGNCSRRYPVRDGIPDFRDRPSYWCNVSRDKMRSLIDLCRKSGDWKSSAKAIVPEFMGHFSPFHRADSQFIWPTDRDSVILDAGSMWGGITLPAAQYHKRVFAIDQTLETLEFLDIRSSQMGFENVTPLACPLKATPFPENFFDLVVLSGVLEWVAVEDDIDLSRQWLKTGGGLKLSDRKYRLSPRRMQLDVLKELNRILKPDGTLYFAIENSVGYNYLTGYPDDHMNLPFVGFLPRFLSNMICRIVLKCDYRTYVYSSWGCGFLLREAGFVKNEFFGSFMHYINSQYIIPFGKISDFKNDILRISPGRRSKVVVRMTPSRSLKFLSPSFIVISNKSQIEKPQRLVRILGEIGLLEGNVGYDVVKLPCRDCNEQPAHFQISRKGEAEGLFFCKVGRSKNDYEILTNEARNLNIAHEALRNSPIKNNIPKVAFNGMVEDIPLLVTKHVPLRHAEFHLSQSLFDGKTEKVDRDVFKALDFLVDFQLSTATKKVTVEDCLLPEISKFRTVLRETGADVSGLDGALDGVTRFLTEKAKVEFPLCAVHGDFDFFDNVMFLRHEVFLVDFEHYSREGLPFFDFSSLIFNLLLLCDERFTRNAPLIDLLTNPRVKTRVRNWFKRYSEKSGVELELLFVAPHVSALQTKCMEYPNYRDPETFPMYVDDNFRSMLNLPFDFLY